MAPVGPVATARCRGSRMEIVGPTLCWALHSRWEHVVEYGSSRHWGGQGVVEPREGNQGNRRRLPRLEAPGGQNAALAVAACVRDPVCFGCGCGCGSRVAKGDREQALRGARMLVRGVKLWGEGLVVVLQRQGVWRGVGRGGEQRVL
jgi:hypothetical protein